MATDAWMLPVGKREAGIVPSGVEWKSGHGRRPPPAANVVPRGACFAALMSAASGLPMRAHRRRSSPQGRDRLGRQAITKCKRFCSGVEHDALNESRAETIA